MNKSGTRYDYDLNVRRSVGLGANSAFKQNELGQRRASPALSRTPIPASSSRDHREHRHRTRKDSPGADSRRDSIRSGGYDSGRERRERDRHSRSARRSPARSNQDTWSDHSSRSRLDELIVEGNVTEEVQMPVIHMVEKNITKVVEVKEEEVVNKYVEVMEDRIVEVPFDKVVEIEVDKIVIKTVEVPVERVVEKIVEVPVEVPVERTVEKIVEVAVEVPVVRVVEKVVEIPVHHKIERVVEIPTEKIVQLSGGASSGLLAELSASKRETGRLKASNRQLESQLAHLEEQVRQYKRTGGDHGESRHNNGRNSARYDLGDAPLSARDYGQSSDISPSSASTYGGGGARYREDRSDRRGYGGERERRGLRSPRERETPQYGVSTTRMYRG